MMFYPLDHAPLYSLYCYTAGKAFNPAQPTVVFIHGVLHDHSVWALQSRFLAHHGYNVLALDLPGHARSGGTPPETVEQAADAVCALLDAVGAAQAALVGHSWGSLIALEAASRLGSRATHLALLGTASPMRVSPALLEIAQSAPEQAIATVNVFSHSTLAPPSGTGFWTYGAGMALGRRVLASNRHHNLLHRGFLACDGYDQALTAIQKCQCPVLFILGSKDQMTPPKAAQGLIEAARASSHCGHRVQTVTLPVGHNLMMEAPQETLQALRDFLPRPQAQ